MRASPIITRPYKIIIDTAEQQPFAFEGIKSDADRDNRPIVVETIRDCLGRHPNSLGDYTFTGGEGRFHIERKSQADAYGTFLGFYKETETGLTRRERFEQELANLAKIECGMVLVECTFEQLWQQAPRTEKKSASVNALTVHRSILAWQQDYDVRWVFAGSRREAEIICFRWLDRLWEKRVKPAKPKKMKNDGQEGPPGMEAMGRIPLVDVECMEVLNSI